MVLVPSRCGLVALVAAATLAVISPTVSAAECPISLSPGDQAAGILVFTDPTCTTATRSQLGCANGNCRYCRVAVTAQSSHLASCVELGFDPSTAKTPVPPRSALPATCPVQASDGDARLGIRIVTDASCAFGGLGCFQDVCRFCRLPGSTALVQFLPCASFGYSETQSPAPTQPPTTSPSSQPPTPVPTTQAPPTSPPPTPAPTPNPCDDVVKAIKFEPGLTAKPDAACKTDPNVQRTCLNDCRVCWTEWNTYVSNAIGMFGGPQYVVNCDTFGATTTAPPTPPPTTVAPTSPPATEAPTPLPTTQAPDPCADTRQQLRLPPGLSAKYDIACSDGAVRRACNEMCRICWTQWTSIAETLATSMGSIFVTCSAIPGPNP